MSIITTRLIVAEDGTISTLTPLPAGVHLANIEVMEELPPRQLPSKPFDVNALPTIDLGPWPEGVTLRREDMYGDDGR